MVSRILTTASILILSSCAGKTLPNMERPISFYAGCPTFNGICKYSKGQVKEKVQVHLSSIEPEDVSEWIEANVDGVINKKVRILPASSKEFGSFVALPADDLGVLLKYIDSLKRKLVGGR